MPENADSAKNVPQYNETHLNFDKRLGHMILGVR